MSRRTSTRTTTARPSVPALIVGLVLAGAVPAASQEMAYSPTGPALFRTRTTLAMSQGVLGRQNHFVLESTGRARLTLLAAGERMVWRVEYDPLELSMEGFQPGGRTEELHGAVVMLATTPTGDVLDALASGVVTPGIGSRYVERAAAALLPRLPGRPVAPGGTWTDTLRTTEVLQGVVAEVVTLVVYSVADTAAWAGRAVVPVEYRGTIGIEGTGRIDRSRVTLSGDGRLSGHYLYDPAERLFVLHEQEQALDSTLTFQGLERGTVVVPSRQVLKARAERLF